MSETAITSAPERNPGIVTAWIAFSRLFVLVVFTQSIFAGLILSAEPWARDAHRITAAGLVIGALIAGVVALVTLRSFERGRRLGIVLLGLSVCLFIQMTLGTRSAEGERLLWLHIPFGVALVGLAAQLEVVVRGLGKKRGVE